MWRIFYKDRGLDETWDFTNGGEMHESIIFAITTFLDEGHKTYMINKVEWIEE
jgi:hypothetical protein